MACPPRDRSNPGNKLRSPHCKWIFYNLSLQGSPRILEWVAYSFSRRSSQPRNQSRVSCFAGRFFISWATREALEYVKVSNSSYTRNLWVLLSPSYLLLLLLRSLSLQLESFLWFQRLMWLDWTCLNNARWSSFLRLVTTLTMQNLFCCVGNIFTGGHFYFDWENYTSCQCMHHQ